MNLDYWTAKSNIPKEAVGKSKDNAHVWHGVDNMGGAGARDGGKCGSVG